MVMIHTLIWGMTRRLGCEEPEFPKPTDAMRMSELLAAKVTRAIRRFRVILDGIINFIVVCVMLCVEEEEEFAVMDVGVYI